MRCGDRYILKTAALSELAAMVSVRVWCDFTDRLITFSGQSAHNKIIVLPL